MKKVKISKTLKEYLLINPIKIKGGKAEPAGGLCVVDNIDGAPMEDGGGLCVIDNIDA